MPRDQVVVLLAWAVLGTSFLGVGALVRRLCQASDERDDWLQGFFVGWSSVLLGLQLWHLVLPADGRALATVIAAGAIGVLLERRRLWRACGRVSLGHLVFLFGFAAAAWWLSRQALDGPHFGDTGLYHLPAVEWARQYRVIPGLGNLYGPLGYSQSHFLYEAMLGVGPLAGHAHHVANGLLALALVARALLGLVRVCRRTACAPVDVFYALALPAASHLGFDIHLTGLSPDLAVNVLGIVFSAEIVAFLASDQRPAPASDLLLLLVLGVAAMTVKLSMAPLVGTGLVIIALHFLARGGLRRERRVRAASIALAVMVLGAGTWIARGYILSGYPFYPSRFGAAEVDWRVPEAIAIKEVEVMTRGWTPAQALQSLATPAAALHRLGTTFGEAHIGPVVAGGLAAALLAIAVRLITLFRHADRKQRVPLVILIPTLVSLAAWYATSPSQPRLAGAVFWLLGVQGTLLVLDGLLGARRRVTRLVAAALALAVAVLPVFGDTPLWKSDLRTFRGGVQPQVHAVRLPSGLMIYVPPQGQYCWDAPLPCSHAPPPGLRMRQPDRMQSGFRIAPQEGAR